MNISIFISVLIVISICLVINIYNINNKTNNTLNNNSKIIENSTKNKFLNEWIWESDHLYTKITNIKDIPNDIKISIDSLEKRYGSGNELDKKYIVEYQENIEKWIINQEYVHNVGTIKYLKYELKNWFFEKSIVLIWSKWDLSYSFYYKWDKLYWIRKYKIEFNPPKWIEYSRITSETKTDCYISLNNCWEDVLFLKDFIEKIENEDK